jgi:dGTPase
VRQAFTRADERIVRYQTTRRIIDTFVVDLIESTEKRLAAEGVERIEDVWAIKPKLVEFSPEVAETVRELKALLYERLYSHYRVKRMAVKADRIMSDLFETYMNEPRQMPPHVYRKIVQGDSTAGVVADYIAGMTDRFALDEYKKLFDPYERV